MTRHRSLAIAAFLAAMLVAGCGVSTEDEPEPMDTTTVRQPPVIPSVDIEPSPTTSPTASTVTSSASSPAASSP